MEKMERVLGLLIELIEESRSFCRIYISERNRSGWTVKDDLWRRLHEKMIAYINILVDVTGQWFKDGDSRFLNPFDLAHALVGIVNSSFSEWMISPKSYSLISKLDTVLEIFFAGAQRIERRR
jgi:hypothetical protein